jgi:serine/threonine protein kinase/tetratricopeptide (TPR) repeat protein
MFRWRRNPDEPTTEPDTIRHYRITRKLGEGGMGVVYAAHDERLDRPVAIKRIREFSADARLRDRLLREARVAAGISHPNVCHVYELAEEKGELYLVMEFLAGEPLAERIGRGPVPLTESLQITLSILAALEALHARGIVHRDLKPSNVFLTPHGVKLLDFGLARPLSEQMDGDPGLTTPGMILGTPRYMAPELWEGEPIQPASDLFAVGAILFELLAGKAAFGGETAIAVYRAVAHEQPPALSGGPDVMAADRVIQRALAKLPADRYQDAAAMAQDVRMGMTLIGSGGSTPVRAVTRLMVLPFRVLRPDAETDFLAFSVPDAVSASLSGLEAMVVRSAAAARRFAGEAPDLKAIAEEAGVDVVLTGTLLRAGDQVRVATQLVEASAGTLICSHTAQVELTDIFRLQDDLAHQIVDSLSIPLSARDHRRLGGDVPVSPQAYELYLRANHLGDSTANPSRLSAAADLYRRCLAEDPKYAPAWARLGRVYRVLGKYSPAQNLENLRLAQEAFRNALELSPDLPVAHNFYTYFEIEELGRAPEAMLRLLQRVQSATADPNLFAGLVVACRFCGLLEASLAADRRARRLDPGIQTSVQYTHMMLGDYQQAALHDVEEVQVIRNCALWMLGRQDEAIAGMRETLAHSPSGVEHQLVQSQLAAFEGRKDDCVRYTRGALDAGFHDPEGMLSTVRSLAFVGEQEYALAVLDRVVSGGCHCPTTLARDPWLDSLRGSPEFLRILRLAEAGRAKAAAAYLQARGERILGVGA